MINSLVLLYYVFFSNFGLAIIVFTVLVRSAMIPLTVKQSKSMKAMTSLQPKMKALQEKHKDDKQQLQMKMMELYKQEKVNPLAGCLPIFIQIPIFFALYKVLMLNDDYTPMEFVVYVLERFFSKQSEDATRIMLHVHQRGVGICGVYSYEVAETKVTQVMDFARQNEHPLQCTLEKD